MMTDWRTIVVFPVHMLSTDIEAFISAAKGKPDNFERT